MQTILTKHKDISVFSGMQAEAVHHLIWGKFGRLRDLADADGLTIPLLHREHNMSASGTIRQIHDNSAAEALSKMLGQVAWEKDYLAKKLATGNAEKKTVDEWYMEARMAFMRRYGESWL